MKSFPFPMNRTKQAIAALAVASILACGCVGCRSEKDEPDASSEPAAPATSFPDSPDAVLIAALRDSNAPPVPTKGPESPVLNCDAATKMLQEAAAQPSSEPISDPKITAERVCLKSYPWPSGKFLVDEGSDKAITLSEMEQLKTDVDTECLAAARQISGLSVGRHSIPDPSVKSSKAARRLAQGVSPTQMALFGEFLYLTVLRREMKSNDDPDIVRRYETEIRRIAAIFNYKLSPITWTKEDAATYYSNEAMVNGFQMLAAKLDAKGGDQSVISRHISDLATSYEYVRPILEIFGDPREDLLLGLGCQAEENLPSEAKTDG